MKQQLIATKLRQTSRKNLTLLLSISKHIISQQFFSPQQQTPQFRAQVQELQSLNAESQSQNRHLEAQITKLDNNMRRIRYQLTQKDLKLSHLTKEYTEQQSYYDSNFTPTTASQQNHFLKSKIKEREQQLLSKRVSLSQTLQKTSRLQFLLKEYSITGSKSQHLTQLQIQRDKLCHKIKHLQQSTQTLKAQFQDLRESWLRVDHDRQNKQKKVEALGEIREMIEKCRIKNNMS